MHTCIRLFCLNFSIWQVVQLYESIDWVNWQIIRRWHAVKLVHTDNCNWLAMVNQQLREKSVSKVSTNAFIEKVQVHRVVKLINSTFNLHFQCNHLAWMQTSFQTWQIEFYSVIIRNREGIIRFFIFSCLFLRNKGNSFSPWFECSTIRLDGHSLCHLFLSLSSNGLTFNPVSQQCCLHTCHLWTRARVLSFCLFLFLPPVAMKHFVNIKLSSIISPI